MIREKIEELRRQLEYHNFRYYVENAPEISDFEFDAMMRELQDLERAHPEYADPNSPSVRVGSDLTAEFQTVKHRLHRACISLFVAIKIHWAICKQGKAGHETHHRAGQSAEHIDVAMESAGYGRSNRYGGVGCGIHVAADTEGFEGTHHKVRVARTQQANQSNGLAAEGGENQVAVG